MYNQDVWLKIKWTTTNFMYGWMIKISFFFFVNGNEFWQYNGEKNSTPQSSFLTGTSQD